MCGGFVNGAKPNLVFVESIVKYNHMSSFMLSR